MGARPMARVIQDKVKRPLADELLFGKLANGGRVSVDVVDGELAVESQAGTGEAAAGGGRDKQSVRPVRQRKKAANGRLFFMRSPTGHFMR